MNYSNYFLCTEEVLFKQTALNNKLYAQQYLLNCSSCVMPILRFYNCLLFSKISPIMIRCDLLCPKHAPRKFDCSKRGMKCISKCPIRIFPKCGNYSINDL